MMWVLTEVVGLIVKCTKLYSLLIQTNAAELITLCFTVQMNNDPKHTKKTKQSRASFSATEDQTEGLEIHKLTETEGVCSKSAEHLK